MKAKYIYAVDKFACVCVDCVKIVLIFRDDFVVVGHGSGIQLVFLKLRGNHKDVYIRYTNRIQFTQSRSIAERADDGTRPQRYNN